MRLFDLLLSRASSLPLKPIGPGNKTYGAKTTRLRYDTLSIPGEPEQFYGRDSERQAEWDKL